MALPNGMLHRNRENRQADVSTAVAAALAPLQQQLQAQTVLIQGLLQRMEHLESRMEPLESRMEPLESRLG